MFDVLEVEASVPSESEDSSWSTNDDMWTILLQGVLILFNRHAAKKHPAKRSITVNPVSFSDTCVKCMSPLPCMLPFPCDH